MKIELKLMKRKKKKKTTKKKETLNESKWALIEVNMNIINSKLLSNLMILLSLDIMHLIIFFLLLPSLTRIVYHIYRVQLSRALGMIWLLVFTPWR